MNKQKRQEILNWMYDSILQGVKNEEIGSCDSLDDDDITWHCIVIEQNGKKVVSFSTSLNMFPFATGYMTRTGKPRIKWN